MTQVRHLAGRYRILGKMSAGRRGMRWIGEDVASSKPVIIAEASQAKATWLAPAVGVSHAHVAQLVRIVRPVVTAELPLEQGDQLPDAVVVAELVAGRTLAQALINTALPAYQAVRCAAYVASGLDALHRRSAAHGAVSPRSVVLERADEGASPVLTQLAETPHVGFASPERLRGGGPSQQDDVWALHALLYAALTGRVPFRGRDAKEVLEAQSVARPNSLASFGVRDPTLEHVLERGLHPDPDNRTRRIVDVEGELFNWLTANSPSQLAMRALRRGSAPGTMEPAIPTAPAVEPKKATVTPLPRDGMPARSATLRYGVQMAPPAVPAPPPPPISEAPPRTAGAPRIPDLDLSAAPHMPLPATLPSSVPPPRTASPSASAAVPPTDGPKPQTAARVAEHPAPNRPPPPRAPEREPVLSPPPAAPPPLADRPTPRPMTSAPEIEIDGEDTLEVVDDIEEPDLFSQLAEAAIAPPPPPAPPQPAAAQPALPLHPLPPIPTPKHAPRKPPAALWLIAAAALIVAALATTAAVVGIVLFLRTPAPPPPRAYVTDSPPDLRATPPPGRSAPDTPTPAPQPPPTPTQPPSPAQITRCVADFFPPETFDGLQDLRFVCEEPSPKSGCAVMRRRIVMGSRGKVTKAMNEWSRLAWHELAVYAILRQGCCPSPGPIELPSPVQHCAGVGASADALAKAFVKNSRDFDDRLLEFHRAADCAHNTNTKGFDYPAGPISGGQIVFDEFLKRNRSRLHGE